MVKSCYRWVHETLILEFRVQARASRDEIAGQQGDRLRIRLTAAPVDGKANRHLLRYPADLCAVAIHQVSMISGTYARNKRVAIDHPSRLPTGVGAPAL